MKSRATILSAVATVTAIIAVLLSPISASATTLVPYQFFSKVYSEGLGRAIDQGAWSALASSFTANGCTTAMVAAEINAVLTSAEFNGLGYSNAAKVEVAYRTVFNREPDASGYAFWTSQLDGGTSYASVLTSMEGLPEFGALAGTICTNTAYGWGAGLPVALSPSGAGYSGSEAGLQALLDATAPGGVVALQARALVPLTSTLTIPAGVTLTTTGAPSVSRYAEMGRLARQPGFSGPAVSLLSGAKLTNVWVLGDRNDESAYDRDRYTVAVHGATSGTEVTDDRISNTSGASSVTLDGAFDGFSCSGALVQNNLVDGYATTHGSQLWADGITNGCENATISGNTVLDATDVGIISFGGTTTVAQTSDVEYNTVIQSGNAAFGMIAVDASTAEPAGTTNSFAGSRLSNNLIWTSPTTQTSFGVVVGTYPWFGDSAAIGTGATVTSNSSGALSVTAETGIVVSGMLSSDVTGNTVAWNSADSSHSTCPFHAVGAEVARGYASGTIQAYADDDYSDPACITG